MNYETNSDKDVISNQQVRELFTVYSQITAVVSAVDVIVQLTCQLFEF